MAFESIKKRLKLIRKKKRGDKRIGLLVDGPNMLRKEFGVDLEDIKHRLEEFGTVKVGKVFLDQYAPDKLIEAVTNQGFEPVITPTDVDVIMATEAMELVYNSHLDMLALMTRDADFQPVLLRAKSHGKETAVIAAEPCAAALRNASDHMIMLPSPNKTASFFGEGKKSE